MDKENVQPKSEPEVPGETGSKSGKGDTASDW